ncbi:hypothetical protein ACFVH6_25725 [Spirillospora sp. NPDC127200]
MPDVELLVIDAFRMLMPPAIDQRVYTSPPSDWAELMPFLAVEWDGGSPHRWPERLQISDIKVKVFALDRRQGSDLYRDVQRVFKEACLARFTNRGFPGVTHPGVLTYVREVSPRGLIYEGLTSKHPDAVVFQGLFRVTSAPLLP